MLDRGAQSDRAAQREPHDRDSLELELLDQGRDVVGHGLETHRPIGHRGAAMGLKVHPDDTPSSSQQLDVRAEHLDRSEAAVQKDQRRARPKNLVPELDAVHTCDGCGAG